MERTTQIDLWTYPDAGTLGLDVARGVDLTGFSVEATDGGIGRIDEATYDTSRSYIVVDTGPWIFGKKVMLPVGVLTSADHEDEKVFVNRTKDEIKNAPEFVDSMRNDEKYRAELGSYYGQGGLGFRDWDLDCARAVAF